MRSQGYSVISVRDSVVYNLHGNHGAKESDQMGRVSKTHNFAGESHDPFSQCGGIASIMYYGGRGDMRPSRPVPSETSHVYGRL